LENELKENRCVSTLKDMCERSKPDMTITVLRYGDTIFSGSPKQAMDTLDTENLVVIDMQEEQHHFTGLPYMIIVRVMDIEDEDEFGMGGVIPPGLFC
jgi:hypothetical protein